jgi:hypothetical protein
MSALNAAKAVLAKCAAYDPWFPKPSEANIIAWAEQIELTNLTLPDLLGGVTDCYRVHGSGFRPFPADVIGASRRIRSDRYDRSSIHERTEYEALSDAKAADTIKGIAAGTILGPVRNRTPRLAAAENALQTCHGRTESMTAMREYTAAKHEAHRAENREPEISKAIAKRYCVCRRPIFDDAETCDRCQPIINGPQTNGDTQTA